MLQLPPLSLYIHIPWCVRKCPYCDFNSHAVKSGGIPEADYVQALLADLRQELPRVQGRCIDTIFIGGGTPSLFSPAAIGQILQQADQLIPFSAEVEITLEANPGTFEQARFAGFKAAGVNRLSVGVQSFNDQHLQGLGRIHSGAEAHQALQSARHLGFDHLNIDLMHGLPGQTWQHAEADLQQALALTPDHLSWYQLTIEPNTEFFSRPPVLPQEEALWHIQQRGQQLLAQHGFHQYEVSAYATSEQARARHNLNYWRFGDYIGIGAGAHGKLTLPEENDIIRRTKQRSPKAYLQALDPCSQHHSVPVGERPFEFMLNALRLIEGVDEALFSSRTGVILAQIEPLLAQARARQLLAPSPHLRATAKGQMFLNDLLEVFLS